MSYVEPYIIEDIKINSIPLERTIDSDTVDERVRSEFLKRRYQDLPRSKDEAKARGMSKWSGLMSSFPEIRTYKVSPGRVIVSADILPTRYHIGEAFRDYYKDQEELGHPLSQDTIERISPNMANAHVMVPTKWKGEYVLLAQIKGEALGRGEVHSSVVAGNVEAKHIYAGVDPLINSLKQECLEEVGLDLSYFNSTTWKYLINEQDTGQMAVVSIAREVELETVLHAYEANVRFKVGKEKLEVEGLVPLPMAGIVVIPLGNKGKTQDELLCYLPRPEGLVAVKQKRVLRPITVGVLKYLENAQNRKDMLETAGF